MAAAAGYAILVIAARTLDPAQNADFLVFWSVLFGAFGVLGGLQQETTRSVASATLGATRGLGPTGLGTTGDLGGDPDARAGVRVLAAALTVGAGLAVVIAASSPAWSGPILGANAPVLVLTLCVACVAYAGHGTVVGSLAGARAWPPSARLIGAEATVRLALVALAAATAGTLLGLEIASAAAASTWLVFLLLSRSARAAAAARGDCGPRRFASHALRAMVASAASAALIVGYPALLRASTPDAVWSTSAPLLLAISLTRAPLLVPLGAYQGVAITHFLVHRERGTAVVVRWIGIVATVGAVGAVLAYLLGPALMAAFFGPDYRVSGMLVAFLTAASSSLAALTLTGSAVLAIGRHTAYAVGWFSATAVSCAILLLDLAIETRAALSLAIGPLVGVAIHLAVIRRWSADVTAPVA